MPTTPTTETDSTMSVREQLPQTAPVQVVVAEDESIIRLDLCETLTGLGYDVVGEASRGDEAEALIRALEPDLAILDIKMPGRSGIDVARSLASELVCGVLILSAFSQQALVEEAAGAGVLAYLVKPFQHAELSTAIDVAVARHRQMVELSGRIDDLERRLVDRKTVDRAKGKLIGRHNMTEAEAMIFLQRRAMDGRQAMRTVAADILSGDIEI